MKKRNLLIPVLIISLIFLISCTEQISDEELDKELEELSEEELEYVLAEDEAIVGEAFTLYRRTPKLSKLRRVVDFKRRISTCTDNDLGRNYLIKGIAGTRDKSFTDYCQDSRYLFEYDCGYAGGINFQDGCGHSTLGSCRFDCKSLGYACEDGACVNIDVLLFSMSTLNQGPGFDDTLNEYINVLKTEENLTARFIDLDSLEAQGRFGVRVSNKNDWFEVKEVLRKIIGDWSPSFVIILGGEQVVPRPETAVECSDGNYNVKSDHEYINFDNDQIPDEGLSISRVADYGIESSAIQNYLNTAIKIHSLGGVEVSTYARFSDCSLLRPGEDCYPSPPYCVNDDDQPECNPDGVFSALSSYDYITFAGHGSYRSISIHGFEKFNADLFNQINLNTHNPIVIAYYSCNTGLLKSSDLPSFGVEFLKHGASIYLGRTTTLGINVGDFEEKLDNGWRMGDALFSSLNEVSSSLGCTFIATGKQIALYGDPTIKIK